MNYLEAAIVSLVAGVVSMYIFMGILFILGVGQ